MVWMAKGLEGKMEGGEGAWMLVRLKLGGTAPLDSSKPSAEKGRVGVGVQWGVQGFGVVRARARGRGRS